MGCSHNWLKWRDQIIRKQIPSVGIKNRSELPVYAISSLTPVSIPLPNAFLSTW